MSIERALEPDRRPLARRAGDFWALCRRHPAVAVSLLVVLVFVVLIAGAHIFAPFDPLQPSMKVRLHPPSLDHLFGTDQLGRDVFSRVLHGGRSTLAAALAVVAAGALIGTLIGAISGFGPRWLDELLMRFTDMVLAFPIIILAMAVAAALGAGLGNGVIALAAAWWPQYARVTRGLVLELKSLDFVAASRTSGRHPAGILTRVILPNALPTLMVMATVDIGRAILNFAMLSFLGLGARPPAPEWGAMIAEGAQVMDQWWVATCPALAVLTLVIAFNMIGDGIRDWMDPLMRRRR